MRKLESWQGEYKIADEGGKESVGGKRKEMANWVGAT